MVRRRAVPREVGPPPGGPTRVRTHIPVVFFTARGIPGEVGDEAHKRGAAPAGEIANRHLNFHTQSAWLDCMYMVQSDEMCNDTLPHACASCGITYCISGTEQMLTLALLCHTPAGSDGEEAEYAWLPISCLKPFEQGDAAKHAGRDGQGGEDANLSACVQAAENALNAILDHAKKAEAHGIDDEEMDSAAESDSDGGIHFAAASANRMVLLFMNM